MVWNAENSDLIWGKKERIEKWLKVSMYF